MNEPQDPFGSDDFKLGWKASLPEFCGGGTPDPKEPQKGFEHGRPGICVSVSPIYGEHRGRVPGRRVLGTPFLITAERAGRLSREQRSAPEDGRRLARIPKQWGWGKRRRALASPRTNR